MAKRKYPKKPKIPKKSASLNTWLKYEQRLKEWQQKCKDIDNAKKRKEEIIKRVTKLAG